MDRLEDFEEDFEDVMFDGGVEEGLLGLGVLVLARVVRRLVSV